MRCIPTIRKKPNSCSKSSGTTSKIPCHFTILVGNQDTTLADIATLIKNQLAKIGVDAKVNLMDRHGRG